MGAECFITRSKGSSSQEAFSAACSQARYEYGHRGYTGTIAEKRSFVEIKVPSGENPRKFAQKLIDEGDARVDDKWGPAGCVSVGNGEYLFFGWASS